MSVNIESIVGYVLIFAVFAIGTARIMYEQKTQYNVRRGQNCLFLSFSR